MCDEGMYCGMLIDARMVTGVTLCVVSGGILFGGWCGGVRLLLAVLKPAWA